MMKIWLLTLALLAAPLIVSAGQAAPPLPKEGAKWLDGKPLQWSDLKGNVVLLNVWTFQCWNSYRSLPWLTSLPKKYAALKIIGIHSPEFESEKDRNRMRQAMGQYSVTYPQVLDDEHSYWNALGNRYWPAFYIIDKQGAIRGKFFGETHDGDTQAQQMEKLIAQLSRE